MWIWNPGKSVGKLFFEKKINLDELPFDYSKVDEDGTRIIYELGKQGVRISVDKGIFTSAELRKELVFKGTNLVGANTEAVLKIINDFQYEVMDHGSCGKEIICDSLGAIFWEEEGIIESISVSM